MKASTACARPSRSAAALGDGCGQLSCEAAAHCLAGIPIPLSHCAACPQTDVKRLSNTSYLEGNRAEHLSTRTSRGETLSTRTQGRRGKHSGEKPAGSVVGCGLLFLGSRVLNSAGWRCTANNASLLNAQISPSADLHGRVLSGQPGWVCQNKACRTWFFLLSTVEQGAGHAWFLHTGPSSRSAQLSECETPTAATPAVSPTADTQERCLFSNEGFLAQ